MKDIAVKLFFLALVSATLALAWMVRRLATENRRYRG